MPLESITARIVRIYNVDGPDPDDGAVVIVGHNDHDVTTVTPLTHPAQTWHLQSAHWLAEVIDEQPAAPHPMAEEEIRETMRALDNIVDAREANLRAEIARLTAERDAARAEVAGLKETVMRYAVHEYTCVRGQRAAPDATRCTCGLAAALRNKP